MFIVGSIPDKYINMKKKATKKKAKPTYMGKATGGRMK